MRDYLKATQERVVVFDGGMGATLEMWDLSLEDDYKLPGRAHEALILNRPDVIEGVHASFVEAGSDIILVTIDTLRSDALGFAGYSTREASDGAPVVTPLVHP